MQKRIKTGRWELIKKGIPEVEGWIIVGIRRKSTGEEWYL
jgi:hypothetical protein